MHLTLSFKLLLTKLLLALTVIKEINSIKAANKNSKIFFHLKKSNNQDMKTAESNISSKQEALTFKIQKNINRKM